MIIDGTYIARTLKDKIKERTFEIDPRLTLGIIVTEETPAIRQFVELKMRFGKDIHVDVEILKLDFLKQKNENLLHLIIQSTRKFNGLILQLPLSHQYTQETILNLFPFTHDVDVLGNAAYQQYKEGTLPFTPPVIGAFAEILHRNDIRIAGKKVLVVGEGKLVGAPAAIWAKNLGAFVTIANKKTEDLKALTIDSDVIILGTGVPGILKPEMVKEGVIILDAGSGEKNGVVMGDADQACADKASLFTPTPGGIGPVTVAKVFENLVALDDIRHPERK